MAVAETSANPGRAVPGIRRLPVESAVPLDLNKFDKFRPMSIPLRFHLFCNVTLPLLRGNARADAKVAGLPPL